MIVLEGEELARTTTEGWWDELDAQVLECLAERGPMAPAEVGRRLGISEDAAASVLSLLTREGKVRVRLVELTA